MEIGEIEGTEIEVGEKEVSEVEEKIKVWTPTSDI